MTSAHDETKPWFRALSCLSARRHIGPVLQFMGHTGATAFTWQIHMSPIQYRERNEIIKEDYERRTHQ